jgi:formate hydrogenlyase subunit 6/NADH:ubiquinone oxidoreductase subunit I
MMLSWVRKGLRTGILTTRYPATHEQMPAGFRGKLVFDPTRCQADQGCAACVERCLPEALHVSLASDGTSASTTSLTLDFGRCILCGLCVESCPADALRMSEDYELAATDQEALRIVASFSAPDERSDLQAGHRKEEHDETSA